jgi:hypothetical protein
VTLSAASDHASLQIAFSDFIFLSPRQKMKSGAEKQAFPETSHSIPQRFD